MAAFLFPIGTRVPGYLAPHAKAVWDFVGYDTFAPSRATVFSGSRCLEASTLQGLANKDLLHITLLGIPLHALSVLLAAYSSSSITPPNLKYLDIYFAVNLLLPNHRVTCLRIHLQTTSLGLITSKSDIFTTPMWVIMLTSRVTP